MPMLLTFHGILGYSAFLAMATDMVLVRCFRRDRGLAVVEIRFPRVLWPT
jgi:hypothetical protein